MWRKASDKPPTFDATLLSHGTAFVNALAFLPPTTTHPDGLVISGDRDAIIEVRSPGKEPQDNADALLLGHSGNICALDVSNDGSVIVSGSWDASARVWLVDKWDTVAELGGHEGSVWAVLAYDKDTVITGKSLYQSALHGDLQVRNLDECFFTPSNIIQVVPIS